jgi:hypothetical protein
MTTYRIRAPDGNTYSIDGPEGASDDQVREQVLKQHPNAGAAAAPSVAADVAKEGGKGLVRGVESFVGDVGEAIVGLPGRTARHVSNLASDFGFGKREAEPEPYSSQIAKATGMEASPQTTAGKFAGATGEVLGNPATYLGPGSLALKAGAGVAGAVGSEAAGEVAESIGMGPKLQSAARLVGGVVAGAGGATAASERNLAKLAEQLPTPKNIYDAANAGYDMLKKSNTRISPQGTQDLLNTVKADLHADNFRDYLAPNTYRAIEELGASGSATIGDLDGVRKLLNRVPGTNPTDKEAARRAIDAIDNFLSNVPAQYIMSGDPARDAAILKHAQGNWALHKQLETVEDASIKGQHRAGVSGSGANRVNTARQEIRKILDNDKKSRGMSQAVKDKMEEIVMGTWLSNRARQIGKFAPSGPVSATTSILTGMGAGAGAGAAVAGGGFLAKHLGEYLTDRQIRQLEELMRAESPIGRPIAQAIAPAKAEQAAVPAAAVARSVLTSPLSPGDGSALSQATQ